MKGEAVFEHDILYSLRLRILARSEWAGECLEWQGARNANGYGKIKVPGRRSAQYVHRIILESAGHDMTGRQACHRCDNPRCVRPTHLFPGTRSDNTRDSMAKNRWSGPPAKRDWPAIVQAGQHHNQKLSAADVLAIRARLDKGERPLDVRKDYGLSSSHISAIAKRRRWAHI